MFILKRKHPLGANFGMVYLTGLTKRGDAKYTTTKRAASEYGLEEALKKVGQLAARRQIWKTERI